jgi:site-specific DNA-adenine methylase
MKNCNKKLLELLQDVVLPDIEDNLDDIFAQIAQDKTTSLAQKEEIEQMHEMREDFQSIIEEIKNNQLDSQECTELYEAINEMINEVMEE